MPRKLKNLKVFNLLIVKNTSLDDSIVYWNKAFTH